MKTNTMMRVASVLLVAVLLSTCAIAGTYAKYVTSASGTDTARVAKWNITMKNDSTSTFVDQYDSSDDDKTVDGNNDAGVVAPGTSGSTTYEVDGTPETDYEITFDYDADNLDEVYLGVGTYTYTATAGEDETNNATYEGMTKTVAESGEYYPIKYHITITTTNGTIAPVDDTQGTPTFTSGQRKDYDTLKAALDALKATKVTFDNNKECDLVVKLEWEWAFANTSENANAYDTILGDLAKKLDSDTSDTAAQNAHLKASEGAKYSTDIAYKLIMTATQVGD